jgi:hypothetical protein
MALEVFEADEDSDDEDGDEVDSGELREGEEEVVLAKLRIVVCGSSAVAVCLCVCADMCLPFTFAVDPL